MMERHARLRNVDAETGAAPTPRRDAHVPG
jgi:hypothetical protein